MNPNVHSSIIYNWINRSVYQQWMDKEDVLYMYNGILLSHKNETLPFFNNMDKISQTERQILYDITYM